MTRLPKKGPWANTFPTRVRFEHRARQEFPLLQINKTGSGWDAEITYTVEVPVPYYEARVIKIRLANGVRPRVLGIWADGPEDSSHRYNDGRLCIWHPASPSEEQWTEDEGLLGLIRYTQLHLYREAWVRDTGEPWPGKEAPHETSKEHAETVEDEAA